MHCTVNRTLFLSQNFKSDFGALHLVYLKKKIYDYCKCSKKITVIVKSDLGATTV